MLRVDCNNRFVRINLSQCGNREILGATLTLGGCIHHLNVERSTKHPDRFAIGPVPYGLCDGVARMSLQTDCHCYYLPVHVRMSPPPETPHKHNPTFSNMGATIAVCCANDETLPDG